MVSAIGATPPRTELAALVRRSMPPAVKPSCRPDDETPFGTPRRERREGREGSEREGEREREGGRERIEMDGREG